MDLIPDNVHQHFPEQICGPARPSMLLVPERFECARELTFDLKTLLR